MFKRNFRLLVGADSTQGAFNSMFVNDLTKELICSSEEPV